MYPHNTRREKPISMEETCSTRRWGNHVFPFLLDLSEVNANLGEHHFCGMEDVRPILEFSRLLYRELIKNPYLRHDDLTPEGRKSKRNKHNGRHILIYLPVGGKSTATDSSSQNQNTSLTIDTV